PTGAWLEPITSPARRSELVRCIGNLRADEQFVLVRPAVAEKLPGLPDFPNHVEVQIGCQHFILIARSLRDNLSAWIATITGSVKFSDIPRRLNSYPVDRGDEISVGDRVRRLLQFPQMLA